MDACAEVLGKAEKPMTAEELHKEIVRLSLYNFNAKEPVSILRGAIRKHIRSQPAPRVVQVERNLFKKA